MKSLLESCVESLVVVRIHGSSERLGNLSLLVVDLESRSGLLVSLESGSDLLRSIGVEDSCRLSLSWSGVFLLNSGDLSLTEESVSGLVVSSGEVVDEDVFKVLH